MNSSLGRVPAQAQVLEDIFHLAASGWTARKGLPDAGWSAAGRLDCHQQHAPRRDAVERCDGNECGLSSMMEALWMYGLHW